MSFMENCFQNKKSFIIYSVFCILLPLVAVPVLFPVRPHIYYMFLATFSITALLTFISLKSFIASDYICFLFALTYTFMSWHFLYAESPALCFCGFLPLVLCSLIKITLKDAVVPFKDILVCLFSEVFLMVFQPKWGIVVFIVSVFCFIYRVINKFPVNKYYLIVVFVSGLSFLANGFISETYTGLKLVELFIPLKNARFGFLSGIYDYIDARMTQYETCHITLLNYSHLGLVLSISLVVMIFKFFFLKEDDELCHFCSVLVFALFFFFLYRGITSIVYYEYKAFANYEMFIMVISFLLCITGGRQLEKLQTRCNKYVFYGFSGLLFFVSILAGIPAGI